MDKTVHLIQPLLALDVQPDGLVEVTRLGFEEKFAQGEAYVPDSKVKFFHGLVPVNVFLQKVRGLPLEAVEKPGSDTSHHKEEYTNGNKGNDKTKHNSRIHWLAS